MTKSLRRHTSTFSPCILRTQNESEKAVKAANTALRIDPNYDNARMLIDFIAELTPTTIDNRL